MKNRQILSIAAVIVMGIGTLSGCSGNENSELSYINTSDLATFSNPNIPPIVFDSSNDGVNDVSSNNHDEPSNWDTNSFSYNSNSTTSDTSTSGTKFEISALGSYYSGTTELMEFNANSVKNVILGDANVTGKTIENGDQAPDYVWNYEDKELYVSGTNATIDYTSSLSTSINIIFGPPVQGDDGNVDKFSHINSDLDFCTRSEAVESVKGILSQLNVSVSDKVDVYALRQDDMQAVVNEECEKGKFYQFDSEWQRIPVDSYTVQKNQECYYMVFNAGWNGVPIYNDPLYYMTIKDLVIFHPTITAIYSAYGLSELRITEYRSIVEKGKEITQLISPDAAAQAVGNKYKDVVGMEEISFDKMSLMYVLTPYSENGKISSYKTKIIPAWVCTLGITEYTFDRETGTNAPVTSHKNILIDAQTGLEII